MRVQRHTDRTKQKNESNQKPNQNSNASAAVLNCSSLYECFQLIPGISGEFGQESVRLFILLPMKVLGFAFNLIAFVVLGHDEFNKRFFVYLRVYTANNLFILLIDSLAYVQNWQYLDSPAQYFYSTFYTYQI